MSNTEQRRHVLTELRKLFDANMKEAELWIISSPSTIEALVELSKEIDRLEREIVASR